jgi:hypothetical protein
MRCGAKREKGCTCAISTCVCKTKGNNKSAARDHTTQHDCTIICHSNLPTQKNYNVYVSHSYSQIA